MRPTHRLTKAIFLLCFLLSFSGMAQEPGPWKLKKTVGDIQVFFRKAANSKVNELKIETQFDCTISALVSVLRDSDTYSDWIYKCARSKRIGEENDSLSYYYSVLDFPWPLSDRDVVGRSILHQDPKDLSLRIHVEADPDFMPHQKGLVRIPTMMIDWYIQPINSQQLKICYILRSNPGGRLPAWLLNMTIDQGPVHTMKNLKERVKKAPYRDAQIAFLKNYPLSREFLGIKK